MAFLLPPPSFALVVIPSGAKNGFHSTISLPALVVSVLTSRRATKREAKLSISLRGSRSRSSDIRNQDGISVQGCYADESR